MNGHAEISFNNLADNLATNSTLNTASFPYNEATTFVVTRHDDQSQQANVYGTSTNQTGTQITNQSQIPMFNDPNIVFSDFEYHVPVTSLHNSTILLIFNHFALFVFENIRKRNTSKQ